MKILGIETSAVTASLALYETGEDERVIAEGSLNTDQVHSKTLIPFMEAALKGAGVALAEVDAFAVAVGPGSFTGLRIGVSAIKGMAYALGKPCRAVSSLAGIAYRFSFMEGIVSAVMDARCRQVYNALFRVADGRVERLCADRALSIDALGGELEGYSGKIILAGDGAALVHRALGEKYTLAPPALRYQSGVGVCLAAKELPDVGAEALMPVYLRLPQAERERLAREKG
ncbi:MAG: tRNA (adenosine(37)-N6)-threonylcarbamoyltransferase complex dimerization subunit type 1 TsaB [Bacteroides sp.]|nr:tRNA (adenosine(37)-N6)-threonylcarbamoyltransferase complex dimerization subunit type 1 TsaB [Eubacterium sp.]MCM1418871.1 tRNA (adenosine(37)-N6)-threonylcarbamoyltransferase complex dimerization subunit type 1 TsaB [Roseburia sp.]MCM1463336.1 tRNA (adenosine(37)-N6)-threonylcarbamoyltransferase complex dimerization subunit type 1 TsaB [Bacteroides sp.]